MTNSAATSKNGRSVAKRAFMLHRPSSTFRPARRLPYAATSDNRTSGTAAVRAWGAPVSLGAPGLGPARTGCHPLHNAGPIIRSHRTLGEDD